MTCPLRKDPRSYNDIQLRGHFTLRPVETNFVFFRHYRSFFRARTNYWTCSSEHMGALCSKPDIEPPRPVRLTPEARRGAFQPTTASRGPSQSQLSAGRPARESRSKQAAKSLSSQPSENQPADPRRAAAEAAERRLAAVRGLALAARKPRLTDTDTPALRRRPEVSSARIRIAGRLPRRSKPTRRQLEFPNRGRRNGSW